MTRFFCAAVVMLFSLAAFSQATIRGKVSDASNGDPLPFANVALQGTNYAGQSDFDGNYEIDGVPAGTYTLYCTSVGLKDFTREVTLTDVDTKIININMVSDELIVGEAVVEARIVNNSTSRMTQVKTKKAESMDFITREQILKTGDSDATGAFQRVPGVSTVGDFIFVRGLSDRYLKTNLNGASIPALDPRRNTVEMDIFPTGLVDNLLVIKTASPRYPSDWAGAFISVETRDYPNTFNLSYSLSLGYNTQSTFQDILSTTRSDTDWLGYDNGLRDQPAGIPDTEDWPALASAPWATVIEYAGEINGEDYLQQLIDQGIDPETIGTGSGPSVDDVLELVEIPNGANFIELSDNYVEGARVFANSDLIAAGQAFANTWAPQRLTAGPDMGHSLSFGDQTKLFGRTLGYIFGLQYKRSYRYYDDGQYNRYFAGNNLIQDSLNIQKEFTEMRGTESIYWNALINLAYKLNNQNSIKFMAMPNVNGQNVSRSLDGINPKDHEEFQLQYLQRYSERTMNIFQLQGDHLFSDGKTKISWISSFSRGKQNVPDLKLFSTNYWENASNQYFSAEGTDITAEVQEAIDYLADEGVLPDDFDASDTSPENIEALNGYIAEEFDDLVIDPNNVVFNTDTLYSIESSIYPSPTRFFRTLEEQIWDNRIELELPIASELNDDNRLYLGMQYTNRQRSATERVFDFRENNGYQYQGDLDAYFAPENFVLSNNGYLQTFDGTDPTNTNEGTLDVFALYMGGDLSLTERLRLTGGVRTEKADMEIISEKYNDPGITEQERDLLRGTLDEYDVLPSVNLIYRLDKMTDLLKTTNLRLSYSKSIARPVFREKSPLRGFDFETLEVLKGNPDLAETRIENFDFRLERFPGFGQIYSFSAFYKKFRGAIEQQIVTEANNIEITWDNVGFSRVYGIEFEVRQSLGAINKDYTVINGWDNWSVGANISWIKSETEIPESEYEQLLVGDPDHSNIRPMFGQSPYIINGLLTYNNDSIGLNATIAYNVQGQKLILVTKGLTPDIYEQPRPMLDLTVRKSLGERFGVQVKCRNILNAPIRRTYEYKDVLYDWTSATMGATYSLGIQYRIIEKEDVGEAYPF
ncbi:MAG: carboxypeptidase-like regulatory domain-containing protein [Flavobacteriales bacterium]